MRHTVRSMFVSFFLVGCHNRLLAIGSATASPTYENEPSAPPFSSTVVSSAICEENRDQRLLELIQSVEPIAVDAPREMTLSNPESLPDETTAGGCRRHCTRQVSRGNAAPESIAAISPLADALWVGSIVQGRSLQTGVLAPVPGDRAPMVITVDGLSSASSASWSDRIANPSKASVTDAISRLLQSHSPATTVGQVAFELHEVHNFSEAAVRLGLGGTWIGGSASAALRFGDRSDVHHYVLRLAQTYYTVSVGRPSGPASMFCGGVTADGMRNFVGNENPPGYVAEVNYGRMAILAVDSSSVESEFNVAVQAAFNALVASGRAELSDAHRTTLSNSSTRGLVLGGSGADAVRLLVGNAIEGFRAFAEAGAERSVASPGIPIGYTVRYLRDFSAARLSFAGQYVIDTCGAEDPSTCPPVCAPITFNFLRGDHFNSISGRFCRPHAPCQGQVRVDFHATNNSNPRNWCDFGVQTVGGPFVGRTGEFRGGTADFTATLPPGVPAHIELATPGVMGFRGTGGGAADFTVPEACGTLTINADCAGRF